MGEVKRRYTRFAPDANTLVKLKTSSGIEHIGLASSEAHKGFAGVFVFSQNYLNIDDIIQAEVGELALADYIVRWSREVDTGIFHIGFEYLEG